ncbi:SH3 domain-containing protein [Nocardioides mangrovicus]|uniref:SH3 domain-containing protein n=1 Tax=Nocardioides mangrovicus TaxID=2478913 RepID=A0A3L8P326_9ACTN|nr:SH3 domain-containing protein [Nocardioides mangrovicus]
MRPARRLSPLTAKNPALRAAAVTAPALTVGVVGVGLANAGSLSGELAAADVHSTVASPASDPVQTTRAAQSSQARTSSLSRSAVRVVAVAREGRQARQRLVRFTTDSLDVRLTPASDAQVAEEISSGTKLIATGLVRGAYAEVSWKGQRRWVTAQYLSDQRPTDPADLPLSDAPCPDSSVEHGLTDGAVRVYRAVCHAFPMITSYGGWDAHGEHASGKAIDIMHPSVEVGYQIAEFLKAHAAELGLFDVIWRQHIWTPVRASEGWRSMPNRGSATANHFDHVHVSVN